MEFIDTEAPGSGTSRGRRASEDSPEAKSSEGRRRRTSAATRTSISRTTSIRSLSACWHADVSETAGLGLKLPGCPGTTYGEVFRPIDAELAKTLHAPEHRFVFWSANAVVSRTRADNGYFIQFGFKSRTGKRLAALILDEPADGVLPPAVRLRLTAAVKRTPSTLYCLGGFRYHRETDLFLLQPLSRRHVWVEPGAPG